MNMITALDAMITIAKQLPDEGITFREFITKSAKLRGDSDDVIEKTIMLGECDGFMADDIVKIGQAGTRMH
jgi:hypothetical protein